MTAKSFLVKLNTFFSSGYCISFMIYPIFSILVSSCKKWVQLHSWNSAVEYCQRFSRRVRFSLFLNSSRSADATRSARGMRGNTQRVSAEGQPMPTTVLGNAWWHGRDGGGQLPDSSHAPAEWSPCWALGSSHRLDNRRLPLPHSCRHRPARRGTLQPRSAHLQLCNAGFVVCYKAHQKNNRKK